MYINTDVCLTVICRMLMNVTTSSQSDGCMISGV